MGKYPNIKIGTNDYTNVATINVEKTDGGYVNYIFPQSTGFILSTTIKSLGETKKHSSNLGFNFKLITKLEVV